MVKLEKFEGSAVKAGARVKLRAGVLSMVLTGGLIYTVEELYRASVKGHIVRKVTLEGIKEAAFDIGIFDLCVEVQEEKPKTVNVYDSEADWKADNDKAIAAGIKVHEDLEKSITLADRLKEQKVQDKHRKLRDILIKELAEMTDLSSILLPLYGKNLILGGSASLFLQRLSDIAPNDLDFILYTPTEAQLIYLKALAVIFADINKHIDYTISKDHYVVKVKANGIVVDIIIYRHETIDATDFNNIGVGNLGFQLQSLENVVKAKMISGRPKDYKQLARIFKYIESTHRNKDE